MITTDLTTLKINKLTKAQYEAALAAGTINENELYMTPESEAESGGVFIAQHNTTTNAEIEEAFQAGKTILLDTSGGSNTAFAFFVARNAEGTLHRFCSVIANGIYIFKFENDTFGTDIIIPTLPNVSSSDSGKVLMVDDSGSWATSVIKPTITTTTLLASSWDSTSKTYSFETDYPNASYDIEIGLNSTATTAQAEAFNGAQIVGSATSNVVKAYGIVPTVDIPIILKVVQK